MTARRLRERIRRGIDALEQEALKVKNSDKSSITEVVGAEGKIELCQKLKMFLDTIPLDNAERLGIEDEGYRVPLEERYREILNAAELAVGKRQEEGRKKEDVLIRLFTAYRLRSEGYPFEGIGEVMGRDHSTIIHYVRRRMPDILSYPKIYKCEMDMYNKMNEILEKHEDS